MKEMFLGSRPYFLVEVIDLNDAVRVAVTAGGGLTQQAALLLMREIVREEFEGEASSTEA